MDFRTEWSSWLLIIIMMVIAYFIYPYHGNGDVAALLLQVIGIPLASIAIASIPVLIVCYFIKVIPDIDYSIRVAFIYMLVLLAKYFMQS